MEILGVDLEELEIDHIGSWPFFLRIAMIGFFCFLTAWLGYMSSVNGRLDDYAFVTRKIESLKKSFAESEFKAANLDAYKKEVKIVEAQLSELSEELPRQNELAGFLDDASQQAASSGVKLAAIEPLKDTKKGFYSETEVSLKITGNYNALATFVSNIAAMKRIVTIHNFKIKKSDDISDGSDKNRLIFNLISKTYWSGPGGNR